MHILVIGAAGMVGRKLVAKLARDGGPGGRAIDTLTLVDVVPPAVPEAIGPARTRTVTAAVFVPNLALKSLKGFRVAGAGNVQTLTLR